MLHSPHNWRAEIRRPIIRVVERQKGVAITLLLPHREEEEPT